MKRRVFLGLMMAMATVAMFISLALSDAVGLPAMAVSATGNNTETPEAPETPETPEPDEEEAPAQQVTGPVESAIDIYNESGFGVSITTEGMSGLAGLAAGESLVPTVIPWDPSQAVVNRAMSLGAQVAYAIDISLYVPERDGVNDKVTQLSAPVSIVLQRPEDQDGNTYDFMVIREHNGALTNLADLDNNPDTITIRTDRFSAYTVIYAPKGVFPTSAGSKSGAKDSVPKTGDQLPVAVPVTATVCIAALAMTAFALSRRKRA